MSQANVELVRSAVEAFRAGGIEAVLPFYAWDIVWFPAPEWPEDSAYRGHDGIRRQHALWNENFDDYAWEVHEIRDMAACVVVRAEMTGHFKGSGATIRQPVGLVVSGFRGGQIGEIRSFAGWQHALNAAERTG